MRGSTTSLKEITDASRELLDANAAASAIGVSAGTLSVWRSTGRYSLPFIKVGVKSRLFVNLLDEEFRRSSLPLLEGLNGRKVVERPLGDTVVVGGPVVGERGL